MQPDPFLGTGQGEGDLMARWGFVSDAIIWAYNKLAQSEPITSPIGWWALEEHIKAFVDDTHGIIITYQADEQALINIISTTCKRGNIFCLPPEDNSNLQNVKFVFSIGTTEQMETTTLNHPNV